MALEMQEIIKDEILEYKETTHLAFLTIKIKQDKIIIHF